MTSHDLPISFIVSEKGDDSSWLGACRCLGKNGVTVYRLSPFDWYQSKYCQTIKSPKIYEEPSKYLKFLLKVGEKFNNNQKKPPLFVSDDNGLILVSKNHEKLSKYYNIAAPSWEVTENIVDKSLTYSFAESHGIQVPKTYLPQDEKDLKRISHEVHYPCLLKPAHTHIFGPRYKKKLFKITTQNELLHKYRWLINNNQKMIIQEEIIGPDENNYMLDTCMSFKSEPLGFITSRKIRQYPPIYGVGSFIKSVWAPKVANIGIKLLKELKFVGLANIDFKLDARTGKLVLLEVNGRAHTQISLSAHCGQNLPYTLYKDFIGIPQKPIDVSRCIFKTGEKWVHIMIDVLSMLEKIKDNKITLGNWIFSLKDTKSFGIFSIKDSRPFLSECKKIADYLFHQKNN